MNILNQSITPSGQPVFPSRGSDSQDLSHRPMALPFHGTHSLKSSIQPISVNTTLSAIASGDSPQAGGSPCGVAANGFKSQTGTLEGFINGICNLLGSKDHSITLDDQSVMRTVHDDDNRRRVMRGLGFDPRTLSFSPSLMEGEKLKNPVKGSDSGGSSDEEEPNGVLSVAVCSAVKLEGRQIDLISRKMQRLTGFRNLRLENIIDPSLIAGFVISYDTDGTHVIDLSVKGQLAELVARVESSDQRIASHGQNWSIPTRNSS